MSVRDHDDESEHEQRDRQMLELLNELRVALPGVQILFAFLLTVPFSARWGDLSFFQRDIFYFTFVTGSLSTACFLTPSVNHRLRFHQRERAWVIESANKLAIAGFVFLALAMGGAVLLITDVMFDGTRVWVYAGALWLCSFLLWFARPLGRHLRGKSSGP
jgi:hypothetical protein